VLKVRVRIELDLYHDGVFHLGSIAVVDDDSDAVLDDAVSSFVILRSPMLLGDALAEVHALTSLAAQIRVRLPRVVADARNQGQTWGEITGQLHCGMARTLLRHAGRTRSRRTPLEPD
jgi:hypothetical protein